RHGPDNMLLAQGSTNVAPEFSGWDTYQLASQRVWNSFAHRNLDALKLGAGDGPVYDREFDNAIAVDVAGFEGSSREFAQGKIFADVSNIAQLTRDEIADSGCLRNCRGRLRLNVKRQLIVIREKGADDVG